MKPHVVIADDQVEVRDMLTASLRTEGREVKSFSTGSEALVHVTRNVSSVEMVILDLDFGTGEPDGLEILRQIRADERLADIRVIVATADSRVTRALRDQADLVLIKPVSFRQLRDLAERLISPPEETAGAR